MSEPASVPVNDTPTDEIDEIEQDDERNPLLRAAGWGMRVMRSAEKRSPRVERTLLVVALVVFVLSAWFGWQSLPDVDDGTQLWVLGLAALAAVGALLINGGEFAMSSAFLGRRIPPMAAFHVSVLSTAANAMPIPGAVVMKTRALRQQGQSYKRSVAVTAAMGVMWVAVALVFVGLLQALTDDPVIGLVFLAPGVVGVVTAGALIRSSAPGRLGSRVAAAFGLETASVASAAIRIHLITVALGHDAPLRQSAAFAAAAIIASAVGIFPGGLGLRELLSAGTAGLIGLDPAIGLVVSAVDRILSMAVVGATAGLLLAIGAGDRAVSAFAEGTTSIDLGGPQ